MAANLLSVSSPDLVIGIVGCGIMGRGIAQIAVVAGAQVRLFDAQPGAADKARASLDSTLRMLQEKGRMKPDQVDGALSRLNVCEKMEHLAGCHLVVEAIIENLDIKKKVFAQLEEICGPEAVLVSNTSSLSVTSIAAGAARPERVAGFHFFNPVPLMKLVEVIGGLRTEAHVVDWLLQLGRHWGHTAVQAKDTPGFIVNHAGRGFITEGLRILSESAADVVTIDNIMRDCAGFRLGPFELLDLTALDVSHPVMESIYHQYYEEPRFRPQGLTRQMLAAGMLGRKVGQGFYRYDADMRKIAPAAPAQAADAAAAAVLPSSVWISRERPDLAERVAALVSAAGIMIEDSAQPSASALIVVTPLGDDATTCAAREGLDAERTVGVDAVFEMSKRRTVMTTPATSIHTLDRARTLFGVNGVAVSVMRDSMGLVAQRIVAHIVNVASDIAQQGIAAPGDIDRAVTIGLGYPHGPLAWGDLLGPGTVLTILENLLACSGDPRYRPSPWLRRRAMLGRSLLRDEV